MLPRQVLPRQFYLITRRCTQRTQIDVLLPCAMSNHYHAVIFDRFGRYPEFLEHFHKMFARSQNALHGRWENFWSSEQVCVVRLVDGEDVMDKLVYTATNPVKDGLVDKVHHWPGVNGLGALLAGRPLRADRPWHFYRRDGVMPDAVELRLAIPAELEPEAEVLAELRQRVAAYLRPPGGRLPAMSQTLYRRPLPVGATAFSSQAGRQLFAEALAAGGLDGYFPLAEQSHTQSEPAFCGLGSLVVALNALAIDPGRLWKGPWRWFAEDLLDCCVPLEEVRRRGLDLDEVTCLARCNGAVVELQRAAASDLAAWRASLTVAARGDGVVIAAYDRSAVEQTGEGHFSPIGGYHAVRDLVLVLDVARFKYPPHWLPAERLWQAMRRVDPTTARSRGWITLRRRGEGVALGFTLSCAGDDLKDVARRLLHVVEELGPAARIEDFARALAPLAAHVVLRVPQAPTHLEAIAAARSAVRSLAVFARVELEAGGDRAEATTLLLIAIAERLAPARRAELAAVVAEAEHDQALAAELANLRAQLGALWTIVAPDRDPMEHS